MQPQAVADLTMYVNPNCPICDAQAWTVIGERRYALADLPKLNEYVSKRYRVLFERWVVGKDAVDCKSAACSSCGFVSNIPRPDDRDIREKYQFLAKLGQDYGQSESLSVERRRARALYSFLRPWLSEAGRVLDYGGGDGRLMRMFAEAGHECALVDYNQSPQSFVHKLGDTIDEVAGDLEFEVAICSHVLEHLADPVSAIRNLADCLTHGGILFVEVPMEIWRQPPLHIEPVTHVNFFVPATLNRCVAQAGLNVAYCRLVPSLHPNGTKPAAIRLVAEKGPAASHQSAEGMAEVSRFLNPSRADRLRYNRTMLPAVWPKARKRASQALSVLAGRAR